MTNQTSRRFLAQLAARRQQRRLVAVALATVAAAPLVARADQNWDGDNAVGNFSFANNWFGDTVGGPSGFGFGNGSLHFSFRNNPSQTSIFYDFAGYADTNDIIWDSTFGAGLTINGNGQGLNFNQRLQNDSSFTQTIGASMNLSGAKNGATQIELNPVNGDLVISGNLFNDNSRGYQVFGNNGKTLTLNSTLGVGATAANVSFTINASNNSNVVINAAQTWAGATTANAGSLTLNNQNALQNSTLVATSTGAVNFGSVVSGNAFTLGGLSGSGNLTLANNAATPAAIALSVGNNNASTTYSGILSGAGSLVKIGTGSLTLSGTSTYAGGTLLQAGTLILANAAGAGAGTGTITASGGTTISATSALGSNSVSNPITLSGASANVTVINNNASGGFNGAVTGTSGQTLTISNAGGTVVNFNATTQQFSGFAGTVDILTGSSLGFRATSLNNGGSGTLFNINGTGSITTRNNGSIALGGLTGSGTVGSGTSGSASTTVTYTIGGRNDANDTYSGVIQNGDATHFVAVTKTGTGTQTLSGANTYTGATSVNNGTLNLTGSLTGTSISTSSTGSFTESSAGVIAGSASTFTQGSSVTSTLAGTNTYGGITTVSAGTLAGTNTQAFGNPATNAANQIALSGGTLSLLNNGAGNNGAITYGGPAASSTGYNLTVSGAGTINVGNNGANTGNTVNLGAVVINSQTLTLTNANGYNLALGAATSTGTSTFTNNMANGTTTLASFTDSAASAQTLTFNGTSATGTTVVTGAIAQNAANALAVTQSGAGTLRLAGTSAYTGATTVNSGTLNLTGSLTGATAITVNGGAFTESATGIIGSAAATLTTNGGTTTFSGLNTYTGLTTLNAGTLNLDFSTATNPTTANNIINGANAITLQGGNLVIKGGGTGATNTQNFGGTTTFGGTAASTLVLNSNGGTLNLTLGGIGRGGQGTLDLTFPATGAVTTTLVQAPSNGILVNSATAAYATANGGTSWVQKSTASSPFTLSALPSGSYSTGNANYTSTKNVDVTNGDAPASGVTVNTLRFNAASETLTLAGVNTITTGGILITPTGTSAVITGGTIRPGTGSNEVFIHDYSSVNVASVISNNVAAANLTLTGTGTTTLSGANTYTGTTAIEKGTVVLGISQNGTTSGPLGTGVGTTIVNLGTTLDLSTFNVTVANLGSTGTITSSAAAGTGGTLTDTGTTNVGNLLTGTLAFASVEANRNLADTQIINAANTFTGGLLVRGTDAAGVTGTIGAASFNPAGGQQNSTTINSVRINVGNTATTGPLGGGTVTLDNGQLHETGGSVTIANPITVTANGGFVHFDGSGATGTLSGPISGSGYLGLANGFTARTALSGSLAGFSGTIGIDTGNVGSVDLSGSATGNAAMSLGFFGVSTTTGNVRYTGTGSPTIQIGEVFTGPGSTTTAGLQGSTTAATTVTYQIGDNTANAPSFAGIIANGSGNAATSVTAITKVGSNAQAFSGASTYTGGTAVNAGSLLVNNATGSGTGSGAVTVNNSGTLLGGTGTISGAVTVNSGAILLGGAGAASGTLTLGTNPTLASGSILELALGAAGTHSTIALPGSFNGFNANQDFTLLNLQAGTFDNIITGVAPGIVTTGWTVSGASGAFAYTFTDDGSNIDLSITAVPEPGTVAAGLLALGSLGLSQRRRVRRFLTARRRMAKAA